VHLSLSLNYRGPLAQVVKGVTKMSQSKNVKPVTDAEFDKTVLGKGVALVDFWAEWCGPCRALGPVVDEIAEEFVGKIQVFKMDIDPNPETPGKFQIRGIPTLLIFKDGKEVGRVVGAQPKAKIVAALNVHL
jgi:thioredoxin 1